MYSYVYIYIYMCLVMLFLAKANEWKLIGPGETGISGGHDCLHCPRRNREGGFTPRSGLFITKSFDVSLQPSTWQKSVQGMQCFLPCWECFAQSLVLRSCLQGAAQSAPWVYFYCAEGTFRFQTAASKLWDVIRMKRVLADHIQRPWLKQCSVWETSILLLLPECQAAFMWPLDATCNIPTFPSLVFTVPLSDSLGAWSIEYKNTLEFMTSVVDYQCGSKMSSWLWAVDV